MTIDLAAPGSACACGECVAMCTRRPCWPTPEEAGRLIDAGHGGRLMLDYWAAAHGPDIYLLGTAIISREGQDAPWWPMGRCTFLTADRRCELHDAGLKPAEGRLAIHGRGSTNARLHEAVARTWGTDAGRAMVERWERECRAVPS